MQYYENVPCEIKCDGGKLKVDDIERACACAADAAGEKG
jgi:hypothetical protein